MFHTLYETNENIAKDIDQACLSCPVMAQCLDWGTSHGEYGVWGGIYLNAGKPDTSRNSHKTPNIWQEIRKRINETTDE